MSGLTLGLLSMGRVEQEILQRSCSNREAAGSCVHQATILPVVKKKHQLLVTLLLCNTAAMETLPLSLDMIFNPVVTVILSVTFVLFFGEVIPQAICTRYGLVVGAKFVRLVRVLMIICYPVAYPIGKARNGGDLTNVETTIISGALDMTEKTAKEAMTPIESTFSLDVSSKLDWETFSKILTRGHCRIPVYLGNPRNIIGFLLLVKSLLTVRAETEMPVNAVSIRRIPRVPADMPLYDILNEFQKGRSHMAAVVKTKVKTWSLAPTEGNKFEKNKEASDE